MVVVAGGIEVVLYLHEKKAVTCFAITLVGLAIGFVLLRVEAAVEGEE